MHIWSSRIWIFSFSAGVCTGRAAKLLKVQLMLIICISIVTAYFEYDYAGTFINFLNEIIGAE